MQAGILQGQVDSLMVMDQWQASLMRALAQLQLKSNPKTRQQIELQFDMEDSASTNRADVLDQHATPPQVDDPISGSHEPAAINNNGKQRRSGKATSAGLLAGDYKKTKDLSKLGKGKRRRRTKAGR